MKVLFIGGTGVISSASSALAIERGIDLYLLSRGRSTRAIPTGAHVLQGDIRDKESAWAALSGTSFDVVVDWIAYTPEQIEADLELFRGRTYQFVFISSASVYQTPPLNLPITESTPLSNPAWLYARQKIACEERLVTAYQNEGFPVTIVRPSRTYDRTLLPLQGRFTPVKRMRDDKKVIVHGDGTSLWTMTHHRDFAKGLVGLLGNTQALGEAFHITSDELLSWNRIFEIVAENAGAELKIAHVPSDLIAAYDPDWGVGLLGDKAHSKIFDNSKIKRTVPGFVCDVPFAHGVEEIMAWYQADPARQVVDTNFDQLSDRIIAAYEGAWPK